MRNLKIYLCVILFSIAFIGCDEQNDLTPSEPDFVEVSIPDAYKATYPNGRTTSEDSDIYEMDVKVIKDDGTEVIGKMRFTMPATSDEMLERFELTSNLISETDLSSDFWINNSGSNSQSNGRIQGSCIASCQEAFTDDEGDKIKGRGACKAECWAQTAIKVAAVVVAIVAL